jgi:hypothetical protein
METANKWGVAEWQDRNLVVLDKLPSMEEASKLVKGNQHVVNLCCTTWALISQDGKDILRLIRDF